MTRDEELATAIALRERGHAEEARQLLLELCRRWPQDAEIAYQTAWAHDTLGMEADAVPFYRTALAGDGLEAESRRGALLGLGSSLRVLGRFSDAVATLRAGVAEFPDDGALRTFLAIALYNAGESHEAVRILLTLLTATSDDPFVQQYRRAIEFYAEDLDGIEA